MEKRLLMLVVLVSGLVAEAFAIHPAILRRARSKKAATVQVPVKGKEEVSVNVTDVEIAKRLAAIESASQEEIAKNFEAPKKEEKNSKNEKLSFFGKTKRFVANHKKKIIAVAGLLTAGVAYDQFGIYKTGVGGNKIIYNGVKNIGIVIESFFSSNQSNSNS